MTKVRQNCSCFNRVATLLLTDTSHCKNCDTLSVHFIESKLCTDTSTYSFGHTSDLLQIRWECIKYNIWECNFIKFWSWVEGLINMSICWAQIGSGQFCWHHKSNSKSRKQAVVRVAIISWYSTLLNGNDTI